MNHSNRTIRSDLPHQPSRDDAVAIADQIRLYCAVITKTARADLELRLKSHDSGISAIEHGLLRHLVRGITSMADISRRMGVAPSTLVYVVDGLVKKKLVRRDKDPKDRRREPLQIEKKGMELFAGIPKMESSSILVQRLKTMEQVHGHELARLLKEFVEGLAGVENLYLSSESEKAATSSPPPRNAQTAVTSKARKPR